MIRGEWNWKLDNCWLSPGFSTHWLCPWTCQIPLWASVSLSVNGSFHETASKPSFIYSTTWDLEVVWDKDLSELSLKVNNLTWVW
jgi:hypothetical protein